MDSLRRCCARNGLVGRVLRAVGWFGAALLCARLLVSLALQLWPLPTPSWARGLLHTHWRRQYRDPARTMALLGIGPGMQVLELGPGSGLFSCEVARLLSSEGRLICADVQIGMLVPLSRELRAARLDNVFLQAATAERLPLRDASCDMALAIAVLPMIAGKQQALGELRRVLKPGALLVVSEDLIEPEYVPAWVIRRWCRRAGFVLAGQVRTPWWYLLLFRA